ncbi:uncharacterized protein [Rutidosis leptorrhynchoides]|uniref:uncharacterized protein n=1 Tax=Rutidosis leptorrhynchoides TaxID=125765 RepID=UPI003A99E087
MANNQPSRSQSPSVSYDSTTKVTDVNIDSLVHCTNSLSLQDISNMAVSCKFLKQLAYSDAIWRRFFRERWPQLESFVNSQTLGVREAYLSRYTALKQFKFADPLVYDVHMEAKSCDLLLSKNYIYISQGRHLEIMSTDSLLEETTSLSSSLNDHHARITCMR